MMYITKRIVSFLNRRVVGIFKVLSIAKLVNIFESLADIGNPFHDSYRFLFIIFYVQNLAINVCKILFLSILFLKCIESNLENVNDVV